MTEQPTAGTMYEDPDGTWRPALYVDDGKAIVTHSMIKTMRRCPKQAEYKYVDRLKRRIMGQPLKRGVWMHELLEIHHNGEDWRPHHKKLSAKFSDLFDEERDYYGDMPTEIGRMMESYEWHYELDPWKTIETEYTLESELPDGTVLRGKVDALIENQFGLWLVDHKTHKRLPQLGFRILDAQSALYLWMAIRNKIPVQGFIWNYVRWKPPSVPQLVDKDRRLSRRSIETDYPTFTKAVKQYRAEHPDSFRITPEVIEMQRSLKRMQYRPGESQLSPFFLRSVLEKDGDMLKRVAREGYHTAKRMNAYPFKQGITERVIDRSCEFMCSYTDLCTIELLGGNTLPILKQNYTVGDPMDYYQDRAGEPEREGS